MRFLQQTREGFNHFSGRERNCQATRMRKSQSLPARLDRPNPRLSRDGTVPIVQMLKLSPQEQLAFALGFENLNPPATRASE